MCAKFVTLHTFLAVPKTTATVKLWQTQFELLSLWQLIIKGDLIHVSYVLKIINETN